GVPPSETGGVKRTVACPLPGVATTSVGAPGGRVTVKLVVLSAAPPGVETASLPVTAPAGTVSSSWPPESTVKLAAEPPIDTAVAPMRLVPVTVTCDPTGPEPGVN